MQHRANRNVHGRHRRTAKLHSHRAPTRPIARGRYAVAAALVAGVGVASVAAASDAASTSPAAAKERTQAAASLPLSPTTATPTPTPSASPSAMPTPTASAAGDAGIRSVGDGPSADTGLPFVAQGRKAKPLPLWVNPLPEARVTSCFGQRWGRLHAGVDLAAPDGTPIRAAGAGTVVAAGPAEGYGNAVLIDHGNGYLTHYGHMSAITVTPGGRVKAGDQVGLEGSTGHSTGPHLHFEVHEGTYQNPIEPTRWMHEHGVDIPGCVPLTD